MRNLEEITASSAVIHTESSFGLEVDFDPRNSFAELVGEIEDWLEEELDERKLADLKALREWRLQKIDAETWREQ